MAMLSLLTWIFIFDVPSQSVMADGLTLQPRIPQKYNSLNFNDNFFDPQFALEVYRTASSYEALGEKFEEVGPAKDAYIRWRTLWNEDYDQALEFVQTHPGGDKFKKIFDLQRLYSHWHGLYTGEKYLTGWFPNYVLTFDEWASQFTPNCSGEDPPIINCAPVPDWRSDEEKAADAESLEKGNRARAAWKASPCKDIWDEREANSLEIRLKEWKAHSCDEKLDAANFRKDPDR